jgi:phosphoribosylformylglycinamidine synthase
VDRLSMDFLHEGNPDLNLTARWEPPSFEEPPDGARTELSPALLSLLSRLNLASGEEIARHYDHEVKGLTVIKPWVGVASDVPAEATVLLVRHGTISGYVLSEGVNPFFSDIDTHAMAQSALDEAVRRQLCGGARLDRIAILDNFCWPDPVASPYKMAQLVRACRGLDELARVYGTPLVSGKDSMKNDSTMGGVTISIPPTLLVSAIGRIDDVRDAVTLDLKAPGDAVFVLGVTRDETGGSEYFRWLGERDGRKARLGEPAPYVGNKVPRVRASETLPLYRALAEAIRRGLVRSAATPALGGLALAIARAAMAGELGVDLDLAASPDLSQLPPEVGLFSESNGRFVVSCAAEHAAAIETLFAGLACRRVGTVTEVRRVRVTLGERVLLDASLDEMKTAYKKTFRRG